jgi:cell wall-associated NlpC family hydrolase
MNKKVAIIAALAVVIPGLLLLAVPLIVVIAISGSGGGGVGCGGLPAGAAAVTATAPQDLAAAQRQHAATIVSVGETMGIPPQGIVVGLATAGAETGYRNYANDGSDPRILESQKIVSQSLSYPHDAVGHDHASIGILQQQVVFWGTVGELMDPTTAARKFFDRLLTVRGWESMPVTAAAQAVQGSAFPSAYAAWEPTARQLYGELAGHGGTPGAPVVADVASVSCTPAGGAVGPVGVVSNGVAVQLPAQSGFHGTLTFPTQAAATAAAAGLSQLGVRYSWGGGGPSGPTNGIHDGGVGDSFGDYANPGFDCSGLTLYSYAQAGIFIGRTSNDQHDQVQTHVPWAQALPGDLLFYGSPGLTHHEALYLGADATGQQLMLEAPQSGLTVRVSPVRTGGDFLAGDVARPSVAGQTSKAAGV